MMKPETHFSTFSQAVIYESPLLQRIKMAKQRCKSYPVDSMDFVMLDLERPTTMRRHADFCTGDLTGRYLGFLSASMHLEQSDADRMDELFHRILKCQAPNGAFGQAYMNDFEMNDHDRIMGVAYNLFVGLTRYFEETRSEKALLAAERNAEYFLKDLEWVKNYLNKLKSRGVFDFYQWISEPMAKLYAFTGNERYLEVCRLIADSLPTSMNRSHAHGLLATLRGLQLAAIYSGDLSLTEKVEILRLEVFEKAIWPDGNIAEVLPTSPRNEGCAIGDWIMLNLYSGFISGSDEAYEKAENALHNAFFLNQMVNGGFGTRELDPDKRGYTRGVLSEECWWCCVHNCGLTMTEFADHAVTLKNGQVRVNFLLPGKYTFERDGKKITVEIITRYPEKADTTIFVSGADDSAGLNIRIPKWIKKPGVKQDTLPAGSRRYTLTGKMGYELEDVPGGVILRYGPMIMVPLIYNSTTSEVVDYSQTGIPEGYVPEIAPKDRPAIVPVDRDEDGFYLFRKEPYPEWQYYEEGTISRLAYNDLSINVPLFYADGKIRVKRFYPECYCTTTIGGADLPLVFNKG